MPRFNRAYRGLYGNRMIQFGNKVSFAENKTRRTWKPNVQVKSMYSETLGRMLRFRMTTYAMRCIRKAGGIDEYLVKTKESEIKYPRALQIKEEILAVRAVQRAAATKAEESELPRAAVSEEEVAQEMGTAHGATANQEKGGLRGTAPSRQKYIGLQEILWL